MKDPPTVLLDMSINWNPVMSYLGFHWCFLCILRCIVSPKFPPACQGSISCLRNGWYMADPFWSTGYIHSILIPSSYYGLIPFDSQSLSLYRPLFKYTGLQFSMTGWKGESYDVNITLTHLSQAALGMHDPICNTTTCWVSKLYVLLSQLMQGH